MMKMRKINRIQIDSLIMLYSDIIAMMNDGMTIYDTIEFIAKASDDKKVKSVCEKLIGKMRAGLSLPEASVQCPEIFDDLRKRLAVAQFFDKCFDSRFSVFVIAEL